MQKKHRRFVLITRNYYEKDNIIDILIEDKVITKKNWEVFEKTINERIKNIGE